MYQVTIDEAREKLSQLVQAARNGEEIIITENSFAVAKLITMPEPSEPMVRKAGSALGKGYTFYMADDFDTPLEDFAEYMWYAGYATRTPSSDLCSKPLD